MAASTFMYYLILLICLFSGAGRARCLRFSNPAGCTRRLRTLFPALQKGRKAEGQDEFDLIRSGITDLQRENISMREELSQYLPMLDELFIMKLTRYQLSR